MQGVQRLIVGGLGFPAIQTAFDANALGYPTIVPLDCVPVLLDLTVRGFENAGIQAVEHFSV
jgi:hypothetical protein